MKTNEIYKLPPTQFSFIITLIFYIITLFYVTALIYVITLAYVYSWSEAI